MVPDQEKAEDVGAGQQQRTPTDPPHDEKSVSDSSGKPALSDGEQNAGPKEPAVMSEPKPQAQIIPRSERRGILGRLTLIPEVANPRATNNGTKWIMTSIVALAAATSSTGSSISYRKYW